MGDDEYEFIGGYPTEETARRAFDEADYNRAVTAYRFFYPSVSIMATWKGNLRAGMVANKVFGLLEGPPTSSCSPRTPTLPTRACRWIWWMGRWSSTCLRAR